MGQKFNQELEYFIVEGWYDKTAGLHEGVFYGAFCKPEEALKPVRCVLKGEDAVLASKAAGIQTAKVSSRELSEDVCSTGSFADFASVLGEKPRFPKRQKKPKLPHKNKIRFKDPNY